MRILLDTCALAELRKENGNEAVRTLVESTANEDIFLSVVSLGEIAKGIALLENGRKRRELALWLGAMTRDFAERVYAVDIETAQLWGDLTARAQQQGIQIPAADGLIAATALRHGLHIVTRNARHFTASGALVIDPWA